MVLLLLLEVPFAVVSTLLAVRLLGARRSWVATVLAGTIGWVGGNLVQLTLNDWDWDAARAVGSRWSALAVVFTMLAAVSLDFLARPGTLAHGAGAGLLVMPSPVRDLRRRLAPYARYRQIIDIARRNGLAVPGGRRRRRSVARVPVETALRKTLEEAGVVFVKLGQMASTREDLLPVHMRLELSRLQSSVVPLPREVMQPRLEAELDAPVERVFAEFDWEPIGSASIAQAYAATLETGAPVVVKVQRPAIDEAVARDTTALLHLARAVERRTPQGRQLHVAEIAEEFTHNLRLELDFPLEAANAVDLAGVTDPASGVRIPHMYRELSSAQVLVQERFDGTSVANRDRIAALGLDEVELADRLVQMMAKHMLSHGHFHADPHPGNVLLLDDGTLGLIDFGSTGRLNPRQRTALVEMTMAAMRGDGAGLRNAIEQVAIVGLDGNDAALERAVPLPVRARGRRAQHQRPNAERPHPAAGNVRHPAAGRAERVLPGARAARRNGPDDPAGLLPGRRHGRHARRGSARHRDRRLGPGPSCPGTPRRVAPPSAASRAARPHRQPHRARRVAYAHCAVHDRAGHRVVTTLVNRIVLGLVGGLLVVGSSLLVLASDGSRSSVGTSVTRIFGYVGLILAAILVLRVVAAIVREGYN